MKGGVSFPYECDPIATYRPQLAGPSSVHPRHHRRLHRQPRRVVRFLYLLVRVFVLCARLLSCACPTAQDLLQITGNPSDGNKQLHTVEQVRAYYLVQGAIVKGLREEGSTGRAKLRVSGISIDLWTSSKFLSRHPTRDAYAAREAAATAGQSLLTHPMNLGSLKARVRQHGLHGRLREAALKVQNA